MYIFSKDLYEPFEGVPQVKDSIIEGPSFKVLKAIGLYFGLRLLTMVSISFIISFSWSSEEFRYRYIHDLNVTWQHLLN